MARINEHSFSIDNVSYRLTYYKNQNPNPVIYIRDDVFTGNKSKLLRAYLGELGFDFAFLKGKTPQQLSSEVLKWFSEKSEKKKFVKQTKEINGFKSNSKKIKLSSTNSENDKITNERKEALLKSLDIHKDKINDKQHKKLLIIGCSTAKNRGGEINKCDYFFDEKKDFIELIEDRKNRNKMYEELLEKNPKYFHNQIREKSKVNEKYFFNKLTYQEYLPAIDRYKGRFYSEDLIQLYKDKSKNSNLHILIISGLFGVLTLNDSIIDYHLGINRSPLWTKTNNSSIKKTVSTYIKKNDIHSDLIFYSLSNEYTDALKPEPNWKNLWISYGRGHKSSNFLKEHFLPMI